jgi:hypothetical protein
MSWFLAIVVNRAGLIALIWSVIITSKNGCKGLVIVHSFASLNNPSSSGPAAHARNSFTESNEW